MSVPAEFVPLSDNPVFFQQYMNSLQVCINTDTSASAENITAIKSRGLPWYAQTFDNFVWQHLPDMLSDVVPPDMDDLLTTPVIQDLPRNFLKTHHGIYIAILAKKLDDMIDDTEVYEHRIYIGSGSNARTGLLGRFRNWESETMLPKYVSHSIDKEDYKIIHIGVLFLTRKPDVTLQPHSRVWTLLNEAFLNWTLWSIRQAKNEKHENHYMRHMCPWPLTEFDWSGLCTHSALRDPAQGIDYTEEELIKNAELKKAKAHAWYLANTKVKYAAEKAYRQTPQGKAWKAEWDKSPEGLRRKAQTKRYRQSAKRKLWLQRDEVKQKKAESHAKWRRSEKGKKVIAKGTAKQKAAYHTPEGRAAKDKSRAKYMSTEKGKKNAVKATRKFYSSDKGKAYLKAWRQTPVGKAYTRRCNENAKAKKKAKEAEAAAKKKNAE